MMKSNTTLLKRLSIGVGLASFATIGFLISCEKSAMHPLKSGGSQNSSFPQEKFAQDDGGICSSVRILKLVDNKMNQVGQVEVYNDKEYLYVNALANNDHGFGNAYLFTGKLEDLPLGRNGQLQFKAFNNIKLPLHLTKEHRFKIGLSDVNRKVTMSMMIYLDPKYPDDGIKQAWIIGNLQLEAVPKEVFQQEIISCTLEDQPAEDIARDRPSLLEKKQ